MSAEYAPGLYAVDSWRGEGQMAFRTTRGADMTWVVLDGTDTRGLHDGEVANVRPLVVLDLPDGAKAGWPVLIDSLRQAREATGLRMTFDGLIDQIEAQTRPPKPAEPTGLGAVVESTNGDLWVRLDGSGVWACASDERRTATYWQTINAVRVLAEGVTP